jgi:hypothetical protein
MYEPRHQPPISRSAFMRRTGKHLAVAVALVGVSLAAGTWGYHHFESLGWLDAFLAASMILSGMGPVNPLATDGGKLFAGLYALYSGVLFLVTAGIVFAPLLHRILHKFHFDDR